jgi:putative transposase
LVWAFVYLAVRNLFALVWLLARPRRSKELEILVLRHEIAMLRRQARQPRRTRADRALLAALSRSLPRIAWAGFPAKPETLLRWLVARRSPLDVCAPRSRRPPIESSVRELIRRLAEENAHWGYKRIVGELKGLGIVVSATSVRKVLLEDGLQPAPRRSRSSWRAFLRAHAASMLACDFLTVETVFLKRVYVLFFISLATRRIEYIASTSNSDGRWVTQQARNLVMHFGDQHPFRFLIHDRDTKFSHTFDEVFCTEGVKVIRTPIQAPNANAYAERWVRSPLRLPRPNAHPRPTPPRTRPARLSPQLQRAQTAPSARPHPTGWPRRDAVGPARSPAASRPPRRTHPRIRGRLSLRTLRVDRLTRRVREARLFGSCRGTCHTTATSTRRLLERRRNGCGAKPAGQRRGFIVTASACRRRRRYGTRPQRVGFCGAPRGRRRRRCDGSGRRTGLHRGPARPRALSGSSSALRGSP